MSLVVAIQMDPIESINIDADSTFVLALEAQKRGYRLFHYLPRDLTFRQGQVTAWARPLAVRRDRGNHFTLGEGCQLDLTATDVVLMRQDPPFDMAYITATHLLEHIHPRTLVVNDPVAGAQRAGKAAGHPFPRPDAADPDHRRSPPDPATSAPSTRTSSSSRCSATAAPACSTSAPDDENLNALLEMFTQLFREPVMVQRYLPEVRQGDKRIILVDGEAVGAVNRVPAAGEARSNMHVGGRPEKAELTARDREICAAIGPTLRERGLIFVGIDVIGDYLTEINVTSPTGIQEINRFDGINPRSEDLGRHRGAALGPPACDRRAAAAGKRQHRASFGHHRDPVLRSGPPVVRVRHKGLERQE